MPKQIDKPNEAHASDTQLTLSKSLLISSVGLFAIIAIIYVLIMWWGSTTPIISQQEGLYEQIDEHFNNGDFDSALMMADSILEASPNDEEALIAKATLLAQRGSLTFREEGDGAAALVSARAATSLYPNNPEAWRVLGYVHEIMQNYEDAHLAYEQALVLNPRDAQTLSQQAHAWDLQGELAKAEAGYLAALAVDNTLVQAHMGLARLLIMRGENTDALTSLQFAFENTNNMRLKAEAAHGMAMIEYYFGDYEAAAMHAKAAIEADPGYPLAHVGYGMTIFEKGISTPNLPIEERVNYYDRALEYVSRAIELNPSQAEAYYQLAFMQAAMGDVESARTILDILPNIVLEDITLSANMKTAFNEKIDFLSERVTGNQ